MYDYEVISRIQDLVGSLKGSYKELNLNTTRNVLNTIQGSIQRKDEEMAWVDSCCLQLIGRHKSGKEETFTFQTLTPNVKKEWITELRLAQLALDPNNSPAWERSSAVHLGGQHHHYHHHHQSQHQHQHYHHHHHHQHQQHQQQLQHQAQAAGQLGSSSSAPSLHTYEQQQLQEAVQQKQSRKMPLFVKAMPIYRSQLQTEVGILVSASAKQY